MYPVQNVPKKWDKMYPVQNCPLLIVEGKGKDEVEWFRKTFGTILPAKYTGYSVGNITVNGNPLEDYIVTVPGNDGSPAPAAFRRKDPKDDGIFIRRVGEQEYAMGLTGRTVALWQRDRKSVV